MHALVGGWVQRVRLGGSGLTVSRLCYGTEPFALKKGPDNDRGQGDKTPEEGGRILAEASRLGVNFWDTSEDYGTHPHVTEGLRRVRRGDVVVADKSNAASYEEGLEAVRLSLRSLGTDHVDLMFLHNLPWKSVVRMDASDREYRSENLEGRMGALRAFIEAKGTGEVGAVALSTHSTKVLREALNVEEVDVVCTPLNMHGSVMTDGTLEEHLQAIRDLHNAGKGTYVIKVLNAGRYRDDAEACMRYVLGYRDFIDAWNIGMYDIADVKRNVALFSEVLCG